MKVYNLTEEHHDSFSSSDKIRKCAQVEVHLKLHHEAPLFVHTYVIKEEENACFTERNESSREVRHSTEGIDIVQFPCAFGNINVAKCIWSITDSQIRNEK